MSPVIYEPQGRAGEYAGRALNLFTGCAYGCAYCYNPCVLRKPRQQFHQSVVPRRDILARLEHEIKDAAREPPVLLCFACDPYPPDDELCRLTYRAITMLSDAGIRFTVLTKAGKRATGDFHLYREKGLGTFATTIVSLNDLPDWEPNAPPVAERIQALAIARAEGIPTWVSVEPVLHPYHALSVIRGLHGLTAEFRIGTLNHVKGPSVDWPDFGAMLAYELERTPCDYMIKHDLAPFMPGDFPLKRPAAEQGGPAQ